jgi:PAS domain S-box-containing protein
LSSARWASFISSEGYTVIARARKQEEGEPMTETTAPRPKDVLETLLQEYQDRLDEARRRGEVAYLELFDRPPAGLGAHEIDEAKVLRRVSRGTRDVLGYEPGEMLGRPAFDFIVMSETSQRAIAKKLAGGELKPFVRSFIRKDGTSVPLLLLDRHLKDATGNVVGLRTVYAPVDLGA